MYTLCGTNWQARRRNSRCSSRRLTDKPSSSSICRATSEVKGLTGSYVTGMTSASDCALRRLQRGNRQQPRRPETADALTVRGGRHHRLQRRSWCDRAGARAMGARYRKDRQASLLLSFQIERVRTERKNSREQRSRESSGEGVCNRRSMCSPEGHGPLLNSGPSLFRGPRCSAADLPVGLHSFDRNDAADPRLGGEARQPCTPMRGHRWNALRWRRFGRGGIVTSALRGRRAAAPAPAGGRLLRRLRCSSGRRRFGGGRVRQGSVRFAGSGGFAARGAARGCAPRRCVGGGRRSRCLVAVLGLGSSGGRRLGTQRGVFLCFLDFWRGLLGAQEATATARAQIPGSRADRLLCGRAVVRGRGSQRFFDETVLAWLICLLLAPDQYGMPLLEAGILHLAIAAGTRCLQRCLAFGGGASGLLPGGFLAGSLFARGLLTRCLGSDRLRDLGVVGDAELEHPWSADGTRPFVR